MRAATWPRAEPLKERLLHVDPGSGALRDARMADLPGFLVAGDVLVVNDAATLPASLRGTAEGSAVELRLLAQLEDDSRWRAVLFGAGDFRTPTEHRAAPPALRAGDVIRFGSELHATITHVDDASARLSRCVSIAAAPRCGTRSTRTAVRFNTRTSNARSICGSCRTASLRGRGRWSFRRRAAR